MKYLIIILLFLSGAASFAQTRPTGNPSVLSTNGWYKIAYVESDSGLIVRPRDTATFLPRFTGTIVMQPNIRKFYYYDSTDLRWYPVAGTFDSTSLSNRINLKLSISDTASMLNPYLRKVDTSAIWITNVYRKTASDSVFYVKGGASVFAFRDSVGAGGSGLTSVGLSLPSAFTVTNSPLTSNGTLNVIGAGTSLQYIRGNGTLATTDTGMIPNFYLKVRGLLSGTSPITFNTTTGAIGINNATATGTKGAASFTGAFSDNGSGLVDILDRVTAGSCIGCNITFNSKGIATAFTDGAAVTLNLQQVTDNGNITTDTIIANGIQTNDILPDTISEPDFEIDVLPDLQYQTFTGLPFGITNYPDFLRYSFNWIVANKTAQNIKAVLQVGDLTDDGNTGQFTRVDSVYDLLDANNIPYLYVAGNHDYDGGSPTNSRLTTVYDTWMGPSRYSGMPHYGSNYLGSNANYYIKLDVGRKRFLVMGLEFIPRDAVLTWAQSVLDSNTNRETIVVTHGLVTHYGEKAEDSSQFTGGYGLTGNNGTELWDNLIRKNKQIIMTLNGHYVCGIGCGGGNESLTNSSLGGFMQRRITQTGDYGNIVHMLGYNHQSDSLGGSGQIMRLKFRPSSSRIDVSFFNAIYEGNDPRSQSYSLYYPPVKVAGSLGVEGQLNVAGEATFDSSLKITTLPKYRPVVTGLNGTLDSIASADSLQVLLSQGVNYPPKYGPLPGGSGNYIQNLLPVSGASSGFQTADFWIKGIGVVGGVTGMFSTLSGTPGTFYVSHQAGNFGLVVQRAAGASTSGANMAFFHTRAANFGSALVASAPGDELGTIRWFGTATNLTAQVGISLRALTETVGTDYVSSGFDFRTTLDGTGGGEDITRMKLRPNGNLEIVNLGASGDVLVGASNTGALRKVFLNGLTFNVTGDTLTTSAQTWQQTLTTGSTFTGNNTITGANTNFTWNDINTFRINYDLFVQAKADGTFPYSSIIAGTAQLWEIGYTPTPGTFSKGAGVLIDTNNNVGLGTFASSSAPLYATGNSAYANGLQNQAGEFNRVDNVTSNITAGITQNFFVIDATSGNITITLPAASSAFGASMGIDYLFKRIDNSVNTVTIQRAGSDTIDGANSFTLTTQWEFKSLRALSSSTWGLH